MSNKPATRSPSFQESIDELVNGGTKVSSILYSLTMAVLALGICLIFAVLTYPLPEGLAQTLRHIETGITIIFLFDYILRWYATRFSPLYVITPMAVIDLIAILPLFLSEAHWQFVRVFRLFRILRLLRVFQKGSTLLGTITEVRLRLLRIFFTVFVIVFIASGLIYEIEHKNNLETMGTFFDALYFSVVTITTVGFGDIVPMSTAGKAVTLLMIISGITLIPWQLTDLARYLVEERHVGISKCPHCHLSAHEYDARFCRLCGYELEFPKPDADI